MEKKNVQVQMLSNTISKIENLRETLHTSSRSDVVKMSIDVTEMVASAIANKGEVIIRDKNGKESRIVIPGIG